MNQPSQPRTWFTRIATVVTALALVASLVGVVTLGVSIYRDAGNAGERAAALQAVAGGISLLATIMLLIVTAWYAILTRSLLRQSGPIVSADLRVGWFGQGAVLTGPLSSLRDGPPDQRYSAPSWAVTVRNSGNAATKITGVAVELRKSGLAVSSTKSFAGPTPPFPLDAHSAETVHIEYSFVISALHVAEDLKGLASVHELRAKVTLGSGTNVHSKWEALRT